MQRQFAIRVLLVSRKEFSVVGFNKRHCVERVGELLTAPDRDLVGLSGNREGTAQAAVPTPEEKVIRLL